MANNPELSQTLSGVEHQTSQDLNIPNKSSFSKLIVIVIVIVFVTLLILLGIYFILSKKNNNSLATQKNDNKLVQTTNENDFFFFSIPKPLKDVTLYDLPNDANVNSVVEYEGNLWFVGGGSIIEYSPKTSSLVSYSNLNKANCDQNLVLVEDFIFAPCHIDNIEDAFGHTTILKSKIYTGHYGVYKINPKTHKVEHVFSKKDGLLNGYNYKLYADGSNVWVETFDGVGRINSQTNRVDFYTKELGFQTSSNAIRFSVRPMIVDKDYVWAWNNASVNSRGGISVFNKSTDIWKAFGPNDLRDKAFDRIDLESAKEGFAIKLISGGIQIGFRDSAPGDIIDTFVEKQYSYETGKWTKIGIDRQASGSLSPQTQEYIETEYPSITKPQTVDEFGLTQLQSPSSSTIYQLDGRNNYILSPLINSKKYILTNATVDVIDDTSPFRQTLVKLGERLESSMNAYTDPAYAELVQFFVDPETLTAVVIDSACGGQGCHDGQKAWLIDLKEKKIDKVYDARSNLPMGDLLTQLSMKKESDLLVIKDKNGNQLFNINIHTYILTVSDN